MMWYWRLPKVSPYHFWKMDDEQTPAETFRKIDDETN